MTTMMRVAVIVPMHAQVPNMNPDGSWRGHLRTNAVRSSQPYTGRWPDARAVFACR